MPKAIIKLLILEMEQNYCQGITGESENYSHNEEESRKLKVINHIMLL